MKKMRLKKNYIQEDFHKFFYPTTETERWYEGIITKKSHNNFYVRYEGDDSLYSYPLMDDYKNGDLELKCVGLYRGFFWYVYIAHVSKRKWQRFGGKPKF